MELLDDLATLHSHFFRSQEPNEEEAQRTLVTTITESIERWVVM